jgi:hypothetical protein
LYRLDSPASGIGDIQLTAAIPLRDSTDGLTKVAVRASVKLPTGDASKLLGSGGTDFATGVYVTGYTSLLDRPVVLNAFAGGLVPGDSDVLPELLRDFVAFGGGAAMWQATERVALGAQLYVQAPYYDSDVKELGGNTIQLAVGTAISLRNGGLLRLAILEDVSADTTTDFGLHFSVLIGGGEPR